MSKQPATLQVDKEEDSNPSLQLTVDTTSSDGFFMLIDGDKRHCSFDDEFVLPTHTKGGSSQQALFCPSSTCCYSWKSFGRLRCVVIILLVLTTSAVLLVGSAAFFGFKERPYGLVQGEPKFYLEDILPGDLAFLSKDGTLLAILEIMRLEEEENRASVLQTYRRKAGATLGSNSDGAAFGMSWEPIGQPIRYDHSSFHPVSLSGNGSVVALVLPSGSIQVLRYNEEKDLWLADDRDDAFSTRHQLYPSLETGEWNSSKTSVLLSADAKILAVVHEQLSKGITVDVYEHDGIEWNSMESNISLPNPITSIQAVDLSSDGKTLVITGRDDQETASQSVLLVYKLLDMNDSTLSSMNASSDSIHPTNVKTSLSTSSEWALVGTESILTRTSDISFTMSEFIIVDVSISSDGNTLAVALPDAAEVVTFDGHVWKPLGEPLLTPSLENLDAKTSSIALVSSVSISETTTEGALSRFVLAISGGGHIETTGQDRMMTGMIEYYRFETLGDRIGSDSYKWRKAGLPIVIDGPKLGQPRVRLSQQLLDSKHSRVLATGPSRIIRGEPERQKGVTHVYSF